MRSIVLRIMVTTSAILCAAYTVPGITVRGIPTALIAAVVMGILNVFVRPLLILITLPVTILTFGLFVFIINAALFSLAAAFVPGFEVANLLSALLGSLVVSAVSTIFYALVGH